MSLVSAVTPFVGFLIIKGESERVPGKNFRPLGGRPLLRWVVDALLATPGLTTLLVDTDVVDRVAPLLPDDPRLALFERPVSLHGHTVTANALIAPHLHRHPEAVWLMSHATSPFVRPATFARAVERFVTSGRSESVFGASVHQARFYASDGRPLNHDPTRLLPTQSIERWFEENSSVYVFDRETFSRAGGRMTTRAIPLQTDRLEGVDIDTEDDFAFATIIAEGLGQRTPA